MPEPGWHPRCPRCDCAGPGCEALGRKDARNRRVMAAARPFSAHSCCEYRGRVQSFQRAQLSFGLMIAGTIGNLVDRICLRPRDRFHRHRPLVYLQRCGRLYLDWNRFLRVRRAGWSNVFQTASVAIVALGEDEPADWLSGLAKRGPGSHQGNYAPYLDLFHGVMIYAAALTFVLLPGPAVRSPIGVGDDG